MEITKQFGIQPTLLLAQIVNFVIILFILKRFFYKPIVRMLEERKKRIDQSLKNADLIEQKLTETAEKTAQILENARADAQNIIKEAKNTAEKINSEAGTEAKKTLEATVAQAQVQIMSQKDQMQKQLEAHTLDLVARVVIKVLERNLRSDERQKLTAKSISEMVGKMS